MCPDGTWLRTQGRESPRGEPAAPPGLRGGGPCRWVTLQVGDRAGLLSLVGVSSRKVHSVFVLRAGRKTGVGSLGEGLWGAALVCPPRWQDWPRAGLPGSGCSDSPSTGDFYGNILP